MATYTVDRKTWYRGKGISDSRLLTEEGMRCCIGFVGKHCGILDRVLLHARSVLGAQPASAVWPKWFAAGQGSDLGSCYVVNDSTVLSDAEREAELITIFAEHGDTLLFIN